MESNWHLTTAERLRLLREEKNLSFQKLHDEIKTECGVDISADSLSNYEVVFTQNHTRANKCKGMKIEFLRAIASYYGVSTDWLLGISNIRSSDVSVKAIVDNSGLSEKSAESLVTAKRLVSGGYSVNDSQGFRKMYNIPYYVEEESLFLTCLAIPDFVDTVISALVTNDTLLAQITTAFNLWFASFPEVQINETSIDESAAFLDKHRIAIDRTDFIKLCTYEIANSVAAALSAHYAENGESEDINALH